MGKPRFRHAKYTATVCLCRPPFRPTPSLCRPAPTVIDSSPAPVALSIEPSPRRQGGQSEKNKGFAPRYLCPCPSPRPGPAAVMPWGQRRPRPSAAGPVGLVRRGDPVEPPRARCPRPPCRARVVPVSVVPVPVSPPPCLPRVLPVRSRGQPPRPAPGDVHCRAVTLARRTGTRVGSPP